MSKEDLTKKFNKKDYLTRLTGKIKTLKIFGFDVETCDNNKTFVCASIVGDDFTKFFKDKDELIRELSTNQAYRNSFICATNLHFDILSIFDKLDFIRKFFFIEQAGCILTASTYVKYDSKDFNFYNRASIPKDEMKNYYKITFIDSLAHLKSSVENLGKIIDLTKLKCDIIGNMPSDAEEWKELKKYNIRDSQITFEFMKWLQKNYNDMGCNMKLTIASSSMDLMRRKYLTFETRQEEREKILFQYKSYYGGRTEAFKRGFFDETYPRIKVYDVNSLYPYCMKNFEYPYPEGYFMNKVTSDKIESFNGCAYVHLKANPDLNIPVMPMKEDKLYFPIGHIRGFYDFNTIRTALKNGYEFIEGGRGLVYENVHRPFKNYIEDLYKKRLEFKKFDDNRQLIAKILMNSHYGKYGYNYTNKERLISSDDIGEDDTVTSLAYLKQGIIKIKSDENSKIPLYVYPLYASYVTSYARSVMFNHFKNVGVNRVFYSDTDCIFTDRDLCTSKDLGELKLESDFEKIIIVKPKMYAGRTKDGKDIIRVKGLTDRIQDFDLFKDMAEHDNFTIVNKHFTKLRGSFVNHNNTRRAVNSVYHIQKTLDLNDLKRLWDRINFSMRPQSSNPLSFS